MTQGIILAGGLSERANTNKLLLEINHKPLICHTVDSMRDFVDEIIVVTGRYHNELLSVLKDVKIVENKNYEKGMFSSIIEGVKNVSSDFFLLPGDIPFVKKEVFQKLLCGTGSIRIPSYKNELGHPVFFQKENIKGILSEDINSNLRNFISRHDFEKINVNDEMCLFDVDTLENYRNIVDMLERN